MTTNTYPMAASVSTNEQAEHFITEASQTPNSKDYAGGASIVDVKERLPLSTTYVDLLFESTLPGYYDTKIKPKQKEIVIFNRRDRL